jgi:hypothetical protein
MSWGVKGATPAAAARSIAQDNGHSLIREPPLADSSAAHGSPKQRAGVVPAHLQPGIKRRDWPRWRVDPPILIPLAGPDSN